MIRKNANIQNEAMPGAVSSSFLTKSLPFQGVKKEYDVIMTNANKNNYVIYFHLPSGNFGRSESHWVNSVKIKRFFFRCDNQLKRLRHSAIGCDRLSLGRPTTQGS